MHCVAHIIDIREMVSGLLHKKHKTKNKMIGNKCPYYVCSQFSAAFFWFLMIQICTYVKTTLYKFKRNVETWSSQKLST